MKLRNFYKIDHTKKPIPGSNIRRKSRPKPYSQWKEITPVCCDPAAIDCTCGPRFWVQIDGVNKPVDGTLIKRDAYPLMAENIRYQEINWKSPCCPVTPAFKITWNLSINFSISPSLIIKENGVERVNTAIDSSGEFIPAPDALIEIIADNSICTVSRINDLTITGGIAHVDSGGVINYNFLFTVTEDVHIDSAMDCIDR